LLAGSGIAALTAHRRAMLAIFVGIVCAHLVGGVWLRDVEATRTRQSVALTRAYEQYRNQRLAPGVTPLVPNAVVAGDPAFVDLAVVGENQRPLDHYAAVVNPLLANSEWDARIALNAIVL